MPEETNPISPEPEEERRKGDRRNPIHQVAQSPTTAIAALGALTEELVAARETMARLPSREEVDLRLNQERNDRRRGQRLVVGVLVLLVLGVGVQGWNIEETKDVANSTERIVMDIHDIAETDKALSEVSLEIVAKIDCVVRVAATIPPGPEQQAAYGACIQLAAEETKRKIDEERK